MELLVHTRKTSWKKIRNRQSYPVRGLDADARIWIGVMMCMQMMDGFRVNYVEKQTTVLQRVFTFTTTVAGKIDSSHI